MIISSLITIGQITFVLRVAIQILNHVGTALVGIIIFASVSRVAPIDTHDIINRIIGSSTATKSTGKWVFDRIRRKHSDPAPSSAFFLILSLPILYVGFVSISDIGFLGFYACQVPSSNTVDAPASASSNNAARSLVAANLVPGVDPSQIKVYRCDSTTVIEADPGLFENQCTNWQNSTWADTSFFTDLNSTDSDVMMPLKLQHYPQQSAINLNAFYLGPNTHRVVNSTIQRGLAVLPHDTGVGMIVGIPQLASNKKVDVRTMAVEVDVGCMTIGVEDIELVSGSVNDMFMSINGTWRQYTGPDYMQDVLATTVDNVRSYLMPFFNTSTLDSDGSMRSINGSNFIGLSAAANVDLWQLPTTELFADDPGEFIMGNCTEALQKKLGISYDSRTTALGDMCTFLGIGGSLSANGTAAMVFRRMVCASATQVNMVDATVSVDGNQQITANLTQVPSDLNYVRADFWDAKPSTSSSNTTIFTQFVPYERFTLNENPNSPSNHFIHPTPFVFVDPSIGPGSAGNTLSTVGQLMLAKYFDRETSKFAGLELLDNGLNRAEFTTVELTRWMGQVGSSVFIASVGYNGWAALEHDSIPVVSTGGVIGSCYKPLYALGFLPLVLSALAVFIWMIINILRGAWFGSKVLGDAYSGVAPYTAVACPGAPPNDTLLTWEALPQPHLQVIHKGYPVTGDPHATLLSYLKSAPSYS